MNRPNPLGSASEPCYVYCNTCSNGKLNTEMLTQPDLPWTYFCSQRCVYQHAVNNCVHDPQPVFPPEDGLRQYWRCSKCRQVTP